MIAARNSNTGRRKRRNYTGEIHRLSHSWKLATARKPSLNTYRNPPDPFTAPATSYIGVARAPTTPNTLAFHSLSIYAAVSSDVFLRRMLQLGFVQSMNR